MDWYKLACDNRSKLEEAVRRAIEEDLNDIDADNSICYKIILCLDGEVRVKRMMDIGLYSTPIDGIVVYEYRHRFMCDYAEDIGEMNESAEIAATIMPEEAGMVMRVLCDKYGEPAEGEFYRNRFFDIFSQMFPEQYRKYRHMMAKPIIDSIMAEEDIMCKIFKIFKICSEQ